MDMGANADRELAEKNKWILMLVDLLAGEKAVSRRLGSEARWAWERLRRVRDSVCNLRAELEREKDAHKSAMLFANDWKEQCYRNKERAEKFEARIIDLEGKLRGRRK